jgi:streptogramin lyase
VLADPEAVWLRGYDGTVSRIDPASGAVTKQITPQHPLSAGSLIVAFGSIWTTANDEGRVIRLER